MTPTTTGATPTRVTRQADKGRSFVSDNPLRATELAGRPAVAVRVRLTSYRSLPLSCIEQISLVIDGEKFPTTELRLVLNSHSYPLAELGALSTTWWFILDSAEVVAPLAAPMAPGEHIVDGTLVTVEPYVSNGRFHFTSRAVRRLTLDPGLDAAHKIGARS